MTTVPNPASLSAVAEASTVHNNFLFDFALRRQSLVSLNRVFGMGETRRGDTSNNEGNPSSPIESKVEQRKSGAIADALSQSGSLQTNATSTKSTYSLGSSKMASEKRARRVRFYRNGDRFFKGMVYAVSAERFRTFENLLASLTSSALCDKRVLPNGVRKIFTVDGAQVVESLDQLQDGQSYVCASSGVFRTLDYSKNEEPDWVKYVYPTTTAANTAAATAASAATASSATPATDTSNKEENRQSSSRSATSQSHRSGSADKPSSSKSAMTATEKKQYEDYQRSFVVPRLITVIKNGKRPRTAVRLLLNKKTAQTFDQVMMDISDAVKMDAGTVKKVYAISGKIVTCLADFFQDDVLFLACGPEKVTSSDLELDNKEVRAVEAYKPFTTRSRERVTLKKKSNVPSSNSDRDSVRGSRTSSLGRGSEAGEKSDREVNGFPPDKEDVDINKIPMPDLLNLKYEVGALIGAGNFAVVLECKDRSTRRKYALKIINKKSCKGREHMLDNEVRILRRVKHPNIIRLIEDFSHQHRIFYIMELVKGGDLFDAIASSTKYTEQDASGILYNLASALHYLHTLNIVHRDVKPENLLIRQHDDGTKSLKLGDFGLATEVHSPLFAVCGTPTYVAPEVIAETGYGVKVDIWSAGVITYILLCGFPPFSSDTDDQNELFDLILSGAYEFPSPYWDEVSEDVKRLITCMLEIDPDSRLTAKEVLANKWVATDTAYEADLRRMVSTGLSTHFRRGHRPPQRNAGVQIIASTALDKGSRFFQGRRTKANLPRSDEE